MPKKSIFLACAAAFTLAHSGSVFAASVGGCTATAELQRTVEAEFYACVLKGLIEGEDQATAEDRCAIQYIAAFETDHRADQNGAPFDTAYGGDSWWIEY